MATELPSSSSESQPVVRCTHVSRTFTRGGGGIRGQAAAAETVTAVDNISARLLPGELVGLSGPSGSGKTTLLHLLAGLDTPSAGKITLAGTDTQSLSQRRLTRLRLDHVGIIFQHFHLLPALSARANVAVPLIELGWSKQQRRERAAELLERVGLGDRLTHHPGELSGGEQQRVAVARALATDPTLVVADEPTGELDTETGEQVLDLLANVATDRAVVLASHDQQALDRTDRQIRLQDGARVDES